ncbi:DMT family transporter [Aliiruegeria haliotis]|nr:DMT family transporter [Aliiruegeria haliotis]
MTGLTSRSVAIMLFAMALIPLADSAAKVLVSAHGTSPFYVAWTRFVVGAVASLAILAANGQTPHLRLYANWRIWVRGLLIVGAISSMATALRTEPIADVFGAFFIGPILSYALSAMLLRERVSLARTVILLVGFAGVLLVVRPGFGMSSGIGIAAFAGVCYGSYLTSSRWLAGLGSPVELLLSQMVIGSLVLAPIALPLLPTPTWPLAGQTLVSAFASMFGNLLLIMAYAHTPASRLAPFVYFQLIAATFFGLVFFGDLPDGIAMAGIAIIFLSGIASFRLRK